MGRGDAGDGGNGGGGAIFAWWSLAVMTMLACGRTEGGVYERANGGAEGGHAAKG